MSVHGVRIAGHRTSKRGSKSFVVYDIEALDADSKVVATVTKRYSELLDFHRSLARKSQSVPRFPPKKWFGNKLPAFIESRQRDLAEYFDSVLKIGDTASRDIESLFLRSSQTPAVNAATSPTKSEPDATEEDVDVGTAVLEKISKKLIDANADLPAGVSEDEEKRRQDIYRDLMSSTRLPNPKVGLPLVSGAHDASAALRNTVCDSTLRENAPIFGKLLQEAKVSMNGDISADISVPIADVLE